MSVNIKNTIGNLDIAEINLTHLDARIAGELLSLKHSIQQNERGVLYDLSNVKTADDSGLCALVDLCTSPYNVGFFGAQKEFATTLKQQGLDSLLNMCPTLEQALSHEGMQKFQLSGKKAVILSAGYGKRCHPLTKNMPKPMLPILGRPVLYYIIKHLKNFGIRNILLNPGYLGSKIHDYFQDGQKLGVNIKYEDEGAYQDGTWIENVLGSATGLKNMHHKTNLLDDDFFVFCGDGICDIDLISMLDRHTKTGAIATIATKIMTTAEYEKYGIIAHDGQNRVTRFLEKPTIYNAPSRLANIGVYIFSPRIFDHIPHTQGLDIGRHLLPDLITKGEYVGQYQTDARWLDIGCGADYFKANCALLQQAKLEAEELEVQWRKNVALGVGAQLMHGFEARGDVYIGAGSIVHSGARFKGNCFIGAGSVIEGQSFIENSIIMPGTHVMAGAYVVDAIASGQWAFLHPFAQQGADIIEPLENVCSFKDGIALRYLSRQFLKNTGS